MAAVLANPPSWDSPRLPQPASVNARDRLWTTLFFSAVLHAILILGVNFEALKNNLQNHVSTLEITLVTQRSEQKPERADFLANAPQEGGGNTDAETPPQLPPPAAMEQATPPPAAAEQVKSAQPVLNADAKSAYKAAPPAKTQSKARPAPQAGAAADAQTDAIPSAQELVAQSMRIATLSAEFDNARAAYAQRPRRKFISARTREYKYAAYMEAWRAKVERIGNLNYPEEAKRNNLSGNLVLDVVLNPDGKVRSVELRRSSGHKALDDAAVRIVQLAAPFAPFPKDILAETDILHITRTWQFLHDNRLATQ